MPVPRQELWDTKMHQTESTILGPQDQMMPGGPSFDQVMGSNRASPQERRTGGLKFRLSNRGHLRLAMSCLACLVNHKLATCLSLIQVDAKEYLHPLEAN